MLQLFKFVIISSLLSLSLGEKLMLCYYGSWATYRSGNGACHVNDLDPFICTHLIYSFVGLNNDATIRVMDPWLELPGGRDNFGEFNKLKTKNPNLKTMVAIGGWNEGSAKFSTMANNPQLRAKFVKEASSFAIKYGFDGFDLDWEYPGQRDSPNGSKDIEAFTLLVKELRDEFNKYGLLLTAAVGAPESLAKLSYNIPEISKYLDFIHVMSYDFHGPWDGKTGHNAAMRQYEMNLPLGASNDIVTVYKYWLNRGAPKEKLIMGLPLYGKTFRLSNPLDRSVGAPSSGSGIAGQYSGESGMIGLNELCEKRRTEDWPEVWDAAAEVPYTYKGNDWISYDNHKSLQIKAQYAMSLDIAGVMVWSIETDDFKGICGEKYGYLRTINKGIGRDITNILTTTSQGPSSTKTTTRIPSSTTTKTSTKVPSSTTTKTTTKVPSSTTTKTTTKVPSSTTTKTTTKVPLSSTTQSLDKICTKEGFVRDKNDCSVFYRCVNIGNNVLKAYSFKCGGNLYFDLVNQVCNYPQLVNCRI